MRRNGRRRTRRNAAQRGQSTQCHLAEAGTVIREEHEGFKHLNLQKRDKAEAISILEGILLRLKA